MIAPDDARGPGLPNGSCQRARSRWRQIQTSAPVSRRVRPPTRKDVAHNGRQDARRILHVVAALADFSEQAVKAFACINARMRAPHRLFAWLQADLREHRWRRERDARVHHNSEDGRQAERGADDFAPPAHHARTWDKADRNIGACFLRGGDHAWIVKRQRVVAREQAQGGGRVRGAAANAGGCRKALHKAKGAHAQAVDARGKRAGGLDDGVLIFRPAASAVGPDTWIESAAPGSSERNVVHAGKGDEALKIMVASSRRARMCRVRLTFAGAFSTSSPAQSRASLSRRCGPEGLQRRAWAARPQDRTRSSAGSWEGLPARVHVARVVPLEARLEFAPDAPVGVAKMVVDHRIGGLQLNGAFKFANGVVILAELVIGPPRESTM